MPARNGSVAWLWPRKTPKRTKTIATTMIRALIRSSRDHGTRPLFIEKAATTQYSQNAAHPTAKTSSTVVTRPILSALIGMSYDCQVMSGSRLRTRWRWRAR